MPDQPRGPVGLEPPLEPLSNKESLPPRASLSRGPGARENPSESKDKSPALPRLPGGDRGAKPPAVKTLMPGNTGPEVKALQQRLNARLGLNPPLAMTGTFDEQTREAVLTFQRTEMIAADGVVNPKAWFQLLSRPKVPGPSPTLLQSGVPAWSLEDKLENTLHRVGRIISSRLRPQFVSKLLNADKEQTMSTLAAWTGSHVFDTGQDTFKRSLDRAHGLPASTRQGLRERLGDFLHLTAAAATDAELDVAAKRFRDVLELIGITQFVGLLRLPDGVIGAAPSEPTPEPEPAPRRPSPMPRETKQETTWIAFSLVDADDRPLAGEKYMIKLPDGNIVKGALPESGEVELQDVPPGDCEISFPELAPHG